MDTGSEQAKDQDPPQVGKRGGTFRKGGDPRQHHNLVADAVPEEASKSLPADDLWLMRWVWDNPERAKKRTPEWSWEQLRAANPEKFFERMKAAEKEKAAGSPPAPAVVLPDPPGGSLPGPAVPVPADPGAIEDGPTAKILPLIEQLLNDIRERAGLGRLPEAPGGG